MGFLNIEKVENGFLVTHGERMQGTVAKQWVFETPEGLSKFIKEWGIEQFIDSDVIEEIPIPRCD